jgi:DNA-binding MarR family transcriptional regulator
MKHSIDQLNKVFDSRVRLGIMGALLVNEDMNFNQLKELVGVTDGNLASHLKTLEAHHYIKVEKGFLGRKTNTTYRATRAGEKAFRSHLEALERMIRSLGGK